MAVIVQKGRSLLGSLGTLAQIGGMAMGVPWVSALGMGMNTADGLINGYQTPGFQNSNAMQDYSGLLNVLGGISSGNIAGTPDMTTQRGK